MHVGILQKACPIERLANGDAEFHCIFYCNEQCRVLTEVFRCLAEHAAS